MVIPTNFDGGGSLGHGLRPEVWKGLLFDGKDRRIDCSCSLVEHKGKASEENAER